MPIVKKVNSQTLQKAFTKEYRDFFARSELVVSVTDSFMWTGEYSAYFGGISVCQKVPFRIYAGIEPISGKKIVINGDYPAYHRAKNKFLSVSFLPEEIKSFNQFVNDKLRSRVGKKGGCQISFFSEAPAEEGWGSLGTFSALISLILHFYYFSFNGSSLKRWDESKISDLIKKDPWFDRIFRFAWQANAAAREGITSGTYAFLGLVGTGGFPVVYSTKASFPLGSCALEDLPYNGERLVDLIKNDLVWHFDFGLIYSGARKDTASANRSIREMQEDLDKIKDDDLIKKLSLDKISSLFAHYTQEKSLWLILMEMLDLISFKILLGLKNIFRFGSSEQALRLLFNSLNQHWDVYDILGVNTPKLKLLAQTLKDELQKVGVADSGIKTASVGRGGYIIFAAPKYSFAEKEKNIEKEIKNRLGPDAHFGYLSWLDGAEDGAAKIEQDLKKKIYSPFISHEDIEVLDYNLSFNPVSRLLSREDFGHQLKNVDLILDQVDHQIYLRGKRLTSKEISSAKETILVLAELLEKKGKLKSEQLHISSYSTNRYDFSGKIALPLKRAMKRKLLKELRLKVQGKICSFSINFDPTNLRIWVINRPL